MKRIEKNYERDRQKKIELQNEDRESEERKRR